MHPPHALRRIPRIALNILTYDRVFYFATLRWSVPFFHSLVCDPKHALLRTLLRMHETRRHEHEHKDSGNKR